MCCCLWEVTGLSWAAFAVKATDLWNAQKNSRSVSWNSSWPGGTGHRAMRRHLTARCWYWPLHLFPFALPALATAHSHPLSELSVSWFESLKLARNTCKLDCFNCLILKNRLIHVGVKGTSDMEKKGKQHCCQELRERCEKEGTKPPFTGTRIY